jgi:hypothetical protein
MTHDEINMILSKNASITLGITFFVQLNNHDLKEH